MSRVNIYNKRTRTNGVDNDTIKNEEPSSKYAALDKQEEGIESKQTALCYIIMIMPELAKLDFSERDWCALVQTHRDLLKWRYYQRSASHFVLVCTSTDLLLHHYRENIKSVTVALSRAHSHLLSNATSRNFYYLRYLMSTAIILTRDLCVADDIALNMCKALHQQLKTFSNAVRPVELFIRQLPINLFDSFCSPVTHLALRSCYLHPSAHNSLLAGGSLDVSNEKNSLLSVTHLSVDDSFFYVSDDSHYKLRIVAPKLTHLHVIIRDADFFVETILPQLRELRHLDYFSLQIEWQQLSSIMDYLPKQLEEIQILCNAPLQQDVSFHIPHTFDKLKRFTLFCRKRNVQLHINSSIESVLVIGANCSLSKSGSPTISEFKLRNLAMYNTGTIDINTQAVMGQFKKLKTVKVVNNGKDIITMPRMQSDLACWPTTEEYFDYIQ